jgi:hypothetical protein
VARPTTVSDSPSGSSRQESAGLCADVLGIAMLVLPGQGIFAIVLGVLLADIPGKLKLQQRIVGRQNVMNSLNWLRGKFRRPPLERPSIQTAA